MMFYKVRLHIKIFFIAKYCESFNMKGIRGFTLFQNKINSGRFRKFVSDSNTFVTPYSNQPYSHRIYLVGLSTATSYTLSQWTSLTGLDKHSTDGGIHYPSSTPLDTIIYNPYMKDATITLSGIYTNLNGTSRTSPFVLHKFESIVLIKH